VNGILRRFLERAITEGALEIIGADGSINRFGDRTAEPVRLRFTSHEAERRVTLRPDPGLGEAFMDGGFVVEQGSIYDAIMLLQENINRNSAPWWYDAYENWRYVTRRIRQFNPPKRARSNVKSHYDLTGELYRLFLDEDMQYSCAYFETPESTLEDAQLAKKRHLAAKLDLQPGQRVLDIGSGWGGLGLYMAEHFDVEVVGVTLSDEQHAVSRERAEKRGYADRVDFRIQDYRKIEGPFDRIVSVGMFEHVGIGHYREYFDACRQLLSDDGLMMLHSIGRFHGPGETSAFIQRHIFPGGYIPALSEVLPVIEKTGLLVTDIEILRLHYARTLRVWRERFLARRDEVAKLYDDRFCRMWEFYLAASEMAFRAGGMMNFQIQLSRNLEIPELTRDYIGDAETALRRKEAHPPQRFDLAGE